VREERSGPNAAFHHRCAVQVRASRGVIPAARTREGRVCQAPGAWRHRCAVRRYETRGGIARAWQAVVEMEEQSPHRAFVSNPVPVVATNPVRIGNHTGRK